LSSAATYITVDSATTALQNGDCTGALPNKCSIKTPFSHKGYTIIWIFMKTRSLFSVWKKELFDNIILTQNNAWHITQSE
jgi:hypothetical protein